MALLTSDSWHVISFLPTSAPGWAGHSPPIPAVLTAKVINGESFPIYVIDSGSGTFAYEGGQAFGFHDEMLGSVSAPMTKLTFMARDSVEVLWATDGVEVYNYRASEGYIRSYAPAETAALKAFLPEPIVT